MVECVEVRKPLLSIFRLLSFVVFVFCCIFIISLDDVIEFFRPEKKLFFVSVAFFILPLFPNDNVAHNFRLFGIFSIDFELIGDDLIEDGFDDRSSSSLPLELLEKVIKKKIRKIQRKIFEYKSND